MRFERPTLSEVEVWLAKVKNWIDIAIGYLLHILDKIKKFRGCAVIETDGKGNRVIDIEDTFKRGYVCFYALPDNDTKVVFVKEDNFEQFFTEENGWSDEDLKAIADLKNGDKVSYSKVDVVVEKV
jgi:hypothetical protein